MSILGMISSQMTGAMERNHLSKVDNRRAMLERQQAKFYHDLSMRKWNETNYGAQVEHLRKAGLNIGLMYGQAGQGGQSQAIKADGGNSGNMGAGSLMGIGMKTPIEVALAKSQIELQESQADKNKAEATKISGVDTDEATTRIASLTQGISNQKAEKELIDIQTSMQKTLTDIQNATKDSQIEQAMWNVKRQMFETYSIGLQNKVDEQTVNDKVNIIKYSAIQEALNNELIKANIGKTKEETKAIAENIMQKWKEISQGWVKLNQGERDLAIKKFKEEIAAEYPDVWKVGGNITNKVWGTIEVWEEWLTGAKPYRRTIK